MRTHAEAWSTRRGTRAAVLRVTDVATGGPAPQSITDNPMARVDVPGSDHRPVVATLAAP